MEIVQGQEFSACYNIFHNKHIKTVGKEVVEIILAFKADTHRRTTQPFLSCHITGKGDIGMRNRRFRGMVIGMAGSGALLTAIALLVKDPYWFLMTGTVFVVIGIVLFFTSRTG